MPKEHVTVKQTQLITVKQIGFEDGTLPHSARDAAAVGSTRKLALKKSHSPIRRTWIEFDDMCVRFDTIPDCDGQTDRQTGQEVFEKFSTLTEITDGYC